MSRSTLNKLGTVLLTSVMLNACAIPLQSSSSLDHAASSIRAATVAGAETYAPNELQSANQNFAKAKKLMQHNRVYRAQKLLQLATAHADLAAAISEADHAEDALSSLGKY